MALPLAIAGAICIGQAGTRAGAADLRAKNGSTANSNAESVNTWTIFGFADGADTGKKGESTLFYESAFRLSRAASHYSASDNYIGFAYSLTDAAAVWVSMSGGHQSGAVGGPSSEGLFGGTIGLKYNVVSRATSGVGITLQAEPFTEFHTRSARSASGAQLRAIADAAFVPDRLFGAVNLIYEPHSVVLADGSLSDQSRVEVAAAAAYRVLDQLFVGLEGRYARSFEGYAAKETLGQALFVGPTLSLNIGEQAYVGAAWSVQVAGRAVDDAGAKLDLVNFERHQVRIKAGLSF